MEASNRDCNLLNNHCTITWQMCNFKLHVPWSFHCFLFVCIFSVPNEVGQALFQKKKKKISRTNNHVNIIKKKKPYYALLPF